MPATRAKTCDYRFYLQQGPIDLVIDLRGTPAVMRTAELNAEKRVRPILEELVRELPLLRTPIASLLNDNKTPRGQTAQRMWGATRPFSEKFVTPMAAVAGAVADEILQIMRGTDGLQRIIVNNGGDIALWGAPGEQFSIGIIDDLRAGLTRDVPAKVALDAVSGIHGVATSGWRGRSQSLGIADAVTVFAKNAAAADAAATLVANEVNLNSERVMREPAIERHPDSDLGERLVTTDVLSLTNTEISTALGHGARLANSLLSRSLIRAAVLCVQGQYKVIGDL
ncbi:MAG: UPF0280 family protein [Gammaproteobacteria bacterium]